MPPVLDLTFWGGVMMVAIGAAIGTAPLIPIILGQHERTKTELRELRAELAVVAAMAAGEKDADKLRELYWEGR